MLEVRLLGAFDIKYKNKPITISSRPAQSLFAYLILNDETAHRREKLAGMLWPDSLEETARDMPARLPSSSVGTHQPAPEDSGAGFVLKIDISSRFI